MRKQIITTKAYTFEDIKKFYNEDLITSEDFTSLEKCYSEKLFKLKKLSKTSKIYEIHEYITLDYTEDTYCYLELN